MRIIIESDEQGRLSVTPASTPQPAEAPTDAGAPTNVSSPPEALQRDQALVMNGGGAPSHAVLLRWAQLLETHPAVDAGGPPSHLIEAAKNTGHQEVGSQEGGAAPTVNKRPKKEK